MKIDIPEYNKNTGLQLCWGDGYMIKVASENNKVVISANREGAYFDGKSSAQFSCNSQDLF